VLPNTQGRKQSPIRQTTHGFANRHTESTKTMSKQTPELGKPHSIADHEGIVAIQAKADGERVEIAFDPSWLSEEDIRHIALEHILPAPEGLQRCALRLDGQACEAAAALGRRIEKVPGVRRATATYIGRVLCLTFDSGVADEATVLEGVRAAGASACFSSSPRSSPIIFLAKGA
jgi:hypothetical protein